MTAATTTVHVRVDENTKAQAAEALAEMGLSISDAVRFFLAKVASEKQLPFGLKVPNAETRAAMAEADEMIKRGGGRFHSAKELFDALEKETGQR